MSERLVVVGVPKSGKTTQYPNAIHSDTTQHLDWSDQSEALLPVFDRPGPWTLEGVAALRALRKWVSRNPTGKPCDRVRWLDQPLVPLTKPQEIMAAGCRTIWHQVRPALVGRGVAVSE